MKSAGAKQARLSRICCLRKHGEKMLAGVRKARYVC